VCARNFSALTKEQKDSLSWTIICFSFVKYGRRNRFFTFKNVKRHIKSKIASIAKSSKLQQEIATGLLIYFLVLTLDIL